MLSQNLNRFGTDSEVLPIGRHIKPSLCNVDLIVLAFVCAFECFSLPEVFIFVWMRRLGRPSLREEISNLCVGSV